MHGRVGTLMPEILFGDPSGGFFSLRRVSRKFIGDEDIPTLAKTPKRFCDILNRLLELTMR